MAFCVKDQAAILNHKTEVSRESLLHVTCRISSKRDVIRYFVLKIVVCATCVACGPAAWLQVCN